jgi:hypothetical protein
VFACPGRDVQVTENHFYTFASGGHDSSGTGLAPYNADDAPSTREVMAADAIEEKENNDANSGGLWGQIIAGGALKFSESDVSHQLLAVPMSAPIVPIPGAV